ncbi:MAG: ABC transporter ATP-binding protein [Dysgonomonas sp.]
MIKVNNISKSYNDTVAVDDISLEIGTGEIVSFLGANGAGKSTAMKIITGIVSPDKGSVRIFDYDMAEQPLKAKGKTGYLSENNPLPEDMYVREYLEFVANLYKLKNVKNLVSDSLEKFGLKEEYKKKISSLSKGNRQKLGLAQAIIHDPDFLVLDEPTSALDPNQQMDIKNIIKDLSKSKIVLFSTHILQDVVSLASRVIIVDKGKIMLDEETTKIDSIENLFYSLTNENSSR